MIIQTLMNARPDLRGTNHIQRMVMARKLLDRDAASAGRGADQPVLEVAVVELPEELLTGPQPCGWTVAMFRLRIRISRDEHRLLLLQKSQFSI